MVKLSFEIQLQCRSSGSTFLDWGSIFQDVICSTLTSKLWCSLSHILNSWVWETWNGNENCFFPSCLRYSSKVFVSCPHDFKLCSSRDLSSKWRNTSTWGHKNNSNKLEVKTSAWSHLILQVIKSTDKKRNSDSGWLVLSIKGN